MKKNEHTFSWQALIRIIIMGIIVFLSWKALPVIPVILVAVVLVAALYPVVIKINKKTKIPLIICIFLILILPIVPFILFGTIFIPRIFAEIPILLSSLGNIINSSQLLSPVFQNFNIIAYLQSVDYATTTVNITLVIFSIISTVILTFFFMYDFDKLLGMFLNVVPEKEKEEVKNLVKEVAVVTGKYLRGNFIISIICGVVVYVGLTLLHIPFALPLAIFAAIVDLLPLVGQTVGSIPAIIIGFGVSPFTGVLVIILHLIYQQVENNIISPLIYNKALNLLPSIVFLSFLIGASLFGILGAFLSLPVAASIPAIIQYQKNYRLRHKES